MHHTTVVPFICCTISWNYYILLATLMTPVIVTIFGRHLPCLTEMVSTVMKWAIPIHKSPKPTELVKRKNTSLSILKYFSSHRSIHYSNFPPEEEDQRARSMELSIFRLWELKSSLSKCCEVPYAKAEPIFCRILPNFIYKRCPSLPLTLRCYVTYSPGKPLELPHHNGYSHSKDSF